MRASRGMGAINPAKIRKIKKRDGNEPVTVYKDGGAIWDKPRPEGLGKSKKLKPAQKSRAKAAAKAAGRPYPNLIDNMRAARSK
jgi:hypothetical protein